MQARCCIVGGGPAGMMLGFRLARAGVSVAVLEKHGDFLRDFRGDTVHLSTLTVMHELGLLEAFLTLPHHKFSRFAGCFGDERVQIADLAHLPVPAPFIAMMPQWDFLDFVADHGKKFPGFTLLMNAEAQGLIEEDGKVVGVRAMVDGKAMEIRAELVVDADGRHSTVRDAIGFKVATLGAPMDVLWFRLSHKPDDAGEVIGRFDACSILVMLDRGDYWLCDYVIPKGSAEKVRAEGIEKVRATIGRLIPAFADPSRRAGDDGRPEAADRRLRPAGEMVEARGALHRRCRAHPSATGVARSCDREGVWLEGWKSLSGLPTPACI